MKTCIRLTLVLALMGMSHWAHGQKRIFGTWTASCVPERINLSSMSVCGLCPTEQNIKDQSVSILSFEMTINKKELIIRSKDSVTHVSYIWDKDQETISFTYKNDHYQFSVLYSTDEDHQILKTKEGLMVTLTKK